MKKTLAMSLMLLMTGCACFDGSYEDEEEYEAPAPKQHVYKGYDNRGCNYANGENCNVRPAPARINYYNVQPQRIQPRPIVYRQEQPIIYVKEVTRPTEVVIQPKPAPLPAPVAPVVVEKKVEPKVETKTVENKKTYASCGDIKTTSKEYELNDGSHCAPQVKEVREPVEIVYKKTTYKTVYEPKTTTTVTFEKEPYKQPANEEVVNKTTTTTVEENSNASNMQNVETVTTTTTTTSSSYTKGNYDVLPADEIK